VVGKQKTFPRPRNRWGTIKLRISKEWDWRTFREETSGGCCEHGNELLESVNCGEVLTTWAVLSFFRRRLLDAE